MVATLTNDECVCVYMRERERERENYRFLLVYVDMRIPYVLKYMSYLL